MTQPEPDDGRDVRPSFFSPAFAELLIVGGASLAAVFIVIPNQTSPSDEIGLAPGLVPTVCAVAIGSLAVMQFLGSRFGFQNADAEPRAPLRHALMLMGAATACVFVTWLIGLLAGCSLLALLVSLILGERRIVPLALVTGGVALTVFAIQWMGF